jgi:peroxiredoxin
MLLRLFVAVVAAAIVLPSVDPAGAGEYNPELSIGDAGPAWKALPGVDGKSLSSDDLKEARVVVLVFTCNGCPYAVDYEQRLVDFAKRFEKQSVRLVAVNCNTGPGDSLKAMAARAKERGFPFPYLKDETGSLGKACGALRTPEFVVLDADRKVVYLGAMDDDAEGNAVTKRFLDDAVRAVLAGTTPPVAETPPVGCLVKYSRERRR